MTYECTTPEDVLRTIKDHKIQMIDLRYTDLPGQWQHFSVPPSALDLESFEGGVRFDGSSNRWFREIQESDMHVIPDPASAFLDPFYRDPRPGTDLQCPRSGHRPKLYPRSALYCAEGRGLFADDADRQRRKFRDRT